MLKGRYILLCLLDQRKLKEVCLSLGVSYKYVYSVARSGNPPSLRLMQALTPIIEMSFWAEEADEEFKKIYEDKVKSASNASDEVFKEVYEENNHSTSK